MENKQKYLTPGRKIIRDFLLNSKDLWHKNNFVVLLSKKRVTTLNHSFCLNREEGGIEYITYGSNLLGIKATIIKNLKFIPLDLAEEYEIDSLTPLSNQIIPLDSFVELIEHGALAGDKDCTLWLEDYTSEDVELEITKEYYGFKEKLDYQVRLEQSLKQS